MSARQRRVRRHYLVVGLSLLLHAALLGWLASSASVETFESASAPASMSVDLLSPDHSDAGPVRTGGRPASAKDRPRTLRQTALNSNALTSPSSAVGGFAGSSALSDQEPPTGQLQAALRAGRGCAGGETRALSQEERDKCLEKLGRLSASAPSYDAPIDPAKRAYFDEVAAAGPSGAVLRDTAPGAGTPGSASVSLFKCSVLFGAGKKPKDRQGTVRLGKSPCSIPLQGSFFTPEATVRKR